MKVRLLGEAEEELRQNAKWYEYQHNGLGHMFLDAALNGFDAIGKHPNRFSHPPGTRLMPLLVKL
jgi:hypothetical protein